MIKYLGKIIRRPTLRWGDQDTIWPVTKAALKSQATDRVIELAGSKKNHRNDQIYMLSVQ